MKTFKDNCGRTWTISVEVGGLRRVRKTLDVNLLHSNPLETIQKMMEDPILFCEVLYVLCKPEAEKLGVSDEDFYRAMSGDCIDQAIVGFLEELANFTVNPRDRARILRVVKMMLGLAEKLRDRAERDLEAEIKKVEAQVFPDLLATSGPTSARPPASSASGSRTSDQ